MYLISPRPRPIRAFIHLRTCLRTRYIGKVKKSPFVYITAINQGAPKKKKKMRKLKITITLRLKNILT
jgi:hypothetical protein